MSNLEQSAAIINEPREEIDADLAVGMTEAKFHVFIDKTDEPLTYDMVFNRREPFDFENHTFAAPMMEVAQYNALETLCEKFDSLNDDIRADSGTSLEEYAYELYQSEESTFVWRSELSEWENIRAGILLGEMKYLHNFLNDFAYGSELVEDLNDYEKKYLGNKQNKAVDLSKQEDSYAQPDELEHGGEWQDGYAQPDEIDYGGEWQDGYAQPDEIGYGGEWQDGYAQTDEIDYGGKWQDGYTQTDEIDYGGEWQDGYAQTDEIDCGGEWQDGYAQTDKIDYGGEWQELKHNETVPENDIDPSTDIFDFGNSNTIEAPQPFIKEALDDISETVSDNLFYKIDDLGEEHTDDSFSQAVDQYQKIQELEQKLAKANEKISSLQKIIDKTNAVIKSDTKLQSQFKTALKNLDDKAEKEQHSDIPKKPGMPKHGGR